MSGEKSFAPTEKRKRDAAQKGDILRSREVERGVSNWEYTEIGSGLQAGDRVVSSVDREGVADGVAAIEE